MLQIFCVPLYLSVFLFDCISFTFLDCLTSILLSVPRSGIQGWGSLGHTTLSSPQMRLTSQMASHCTAGNPTLLGHRVMAEGVTKGTSLLKFARVSSTGDCYYSFPGSLAIGRMRRILEPGSFLVTEVSSRWSCWGLKTLV